MPELFMAICHAGHTGGPRYAAGSAGSSFGQPLLRAGWHGLLLVWVLLLSVAPASGAWLRPAEGAGNFHTMIDVFNRWRADGQLDVILLISVANREVTFETAQLRLRGQLQVTAVLTAHDGREVSRERKIELATNDAAEASSGTLYQVFPVVLPDVPFRSGQLRCEILDLKRKRPGIINIIEDRLAHSEAAADWQAPARPELAEDLCLGDPVFLSRAPVQVWGQQDPLAGDLEQSELFAHAHPNRRYGLEQDFLQVFFELVPPENGGEASGAAEGVFVQVLAKDVAFALRDTITIDPGRRAALAAGRKSGVIYDLDINQLPPGAYQLSCAPANGRGRGWICEFDVIWNLTALNRHQDELLGEGRTVMFGDMLHEFEQAGQAEREVMLEKFWSDYDPSPETHLNEAHLEFRRRVAYVRRYLGGYNAHGARDARGQIYLLLGQPDEVQMQAVPINDSDLEDAYTQVYNPYAPERHGAQIKGERSDGTSQGLGPREGSLPLDSSYQAERDRRANRTRPGREGAFELWKYNHAGAPLFPNIYSQRSLGLSFLFLDRHNVGVYELESSNAWDIGD